MSEQEHSKCPSCGYRTAPEDLACSLCGAVLRRSEAPEPVVQQPSREEAEEKAERLGTLKLAGITFGISAVLVWFTSMASRESASMFISLVGFIGFIFRYLAVLVHEMGHAVFAWIFGYPAVPAFDLTYGGGVTIWQDRKVLLVLGVYALFATAFTIFGISRNRSGLIFTGVVLVLFAFLAHTSGHDVVILFMGHGTELLFAGLALYRMLSRSAIINPAERPLYGVIGWFMVLDSIRFGLSLVYSPAARYEYGAAKGGGHWMDFDRIASDHLGISLEPVALFFALCALAVPAVSFAAWLFAQKWKSWVEDILFIDLHRLGLR